MEHIHKQRKENETVSETLHRLLGLEARTKDVRRCIACHKREIMALEAQAARDNS